MTTTIASETTIASTAALARIDAMLIADPRLMYLKRVLAACIRNGTNINNRSSDIGILESINMHRWVEFEVAFAPGLTWMELWEADADADADGGSRTSWAVQSGASGGVGHFVMYAPDRMRVKRNILDIRAPHSDVLYTATVELSETFEQLLNRGHPGLLQSSSSSDAAMALLDAAFITVDASRVDAKAQLAGLAREFSEQHPWVETTATFARGVKCTELWEGGVRTMWTVSSTSADDSRWWHSPRMRVKRGHPFGPIDAEATVTRRLEKVAAELGLYIGVVIVE